MSPTACTDTAGEMPMTVNVQFCAVPRKVSTVSLVLLQQFYAKAEKDKERYQKEDSA